MARRTQVGAICAALHELGGEATVSQIRKKATEREGPVSWLSPGVPNLTLMLSSYEKGREDGPLWRRIAPGTYRLTEAGRSRAMVQSGTQATLESQW